MDGELHTSNPLRPVDSRSRRATLCFERGLLVARSDYDAATYEYARYLRQWDGCRSDAERQRVAQSYPNLHAAIAIFEHPHSDLKFVLEARLLTGDNLSSIGAVMNLNSDVARWYAALFFDVSDRLHCADVIVHHLIGWNCHEQKAWRDIGWKLTGYLGGLQALDQILYVDSSDGLEGLLRGLREEARLILAHEIALAARRLHLADDRMAVNLIRMAAAGNGQPRETDVAPNSLEANIQAALAAIDFAVGTKRKQIGPLAEWDTTAVELRPEEMTRVAMGETLPDAEMLKNLKFPDVVDQ